MIESVTSVRTDIIKDDFLASHGIELLVQREDLIHPEISGNKWRKLQYNISEFQQGDYSLIITFGGAYSNHIAATAAAGKKYNVPVMGIIRGEKHAKMNPTLTKAEKDGMKLEFISRKMYKLKSETAFLTALEKEHPKAYIIPEGGANNNGLLGCSEITKNSPAFNTVVCACGTGSTFAGITSSLQQTQRALGIPVLKNAFFLQNDVQKNLNQLHSLASNWQLFFDYHLGGYAKFNQELNKFIGNFHRKHQIKLDPIYTGKMMFAIYDLIKKGTLKNETVLAIHTGGIQGIKGYESRYKTSLF